MTDDLVPEAREERAMEVVLWDGLTQFKDLRLEAAELRQQLANAARDYDWSRMLELLEGERDLVNTIRPGGNSWFAPLHQAAHGGAPIEVVQRLIDLCAWRSLQNARGERPLDVAVRQGQEHLRDRLEPVYQHDLPLGVLLKIQEHFHAVIRGRAAEPVREHSLRLPELEPLLELDRQHTWFAVPGMAGGFNYRMEAYGVCAKLVAESWCRVAEGSGQRHEITSAGSRMVEEGFV